MSSTSDIISFDLSHQSPEVLDVTRFFPISELHAIRSTKPLFETIRPGTGKIYDFSVSRKLSVKRFRTLAMLDLARSDLFEISKLESVLLDEKPRLPTLDLCPPLRIPYGSVDIRTLQSIPSPKKYPDLYRRSLPISLHTRRTWNATGRYLKKNRKMILGSLLFFLLLSVPTLVYVRTLVESSYAELSSLKSAPDLASIQSHIHRARAGFERANILFFPYRILPGETMKLAGIAIDGGRSLTRGVMAVTDHLPISASGTLIPLSQKNTSDAPEFRPDARDIFPLGPLGIEKSSKWLEKNESSIRTLRDACISASDAYKRAEGLSHPRAAEVAHIGQGLTRVADLLSAYLDNQTDVLSLLGADIPERFLIFNQNRDEIRANGGFPGSIISFTTSYGNLLDFRTDDVYYYDWNLYPQKEIPPPGLALLSDNYGLRDVNYYPDFHTTLEKANAFVEKSGDATVTVGIAINQGIVEDILEKVGPVDVVIGSGKTITFMRENFSPLMSTLVEMRYGERETSKDVLFAFIHALVAKIHEKRDYAEVIDIIESSLRDGEILLASRDPGLDAFLGKIRKPLPWEVAPISPSVSGELSEVQKSTNPNWIYPVLTSLSGNKTDRLMKRIYTSETTAMGNCRYENKLTFTHIHGYDKKSEAQIASYLDFAEVTDKAEREKMFFIQGNGTNKTYLRVYTPPGSVLTGSTAGVSTATGSEVATEFALEIDTPVHATTSKVIRYEVTIPDCTGMPSLGAWYRQPGLQYTDMKSR